LKLCTEGFWAINNGFGWNQHQLTLGVYLNNSWLEYGGYSFNRRTGTWLINSIIPGLGSMILMEDYVGGGISFGFVAGGALLMVGGAEALSPTLTYVGAVSAIGGQLFNLFRPWLYRKPTSKTAYNRVDGFNFAALPKDGEMQYVGTYTKSF